MKVTQIKETCLYVHDLVRCREFYHDKLGFELISIVTDRHIFFRAGTSVLLCFIPEVTKNETVLPPHYAYGAQHIAFEVEGKDYEAWKEKVSSAGIEIIHEHTWGKGHQSFYFKDPDMHVLEIVQAGMWG